VREEGNYEIASFFCIYLFFKENQFLLKHSARTKLKFYLFEGTRLDTWYQITGQWLTLLYVDHYMVRKMQGAYFRIFLRHPIISSASNSQYLYPNTQKAGDFGKTVKQFYIFKIQTYNGK